jgi:hypothetical protein
MDNDGRGISKEVGAKQAPRGPQAGRVERIAGKLRHKAAHYLSLAARAIAPQVREIKFLAKRNCRLCYGRGYTGRRVSDGQPVACTCVKVLGKLHGEIVERQEDANTGQVRWEKVNP